MPWRGPDEFQDFPTLGFLVGDWIEENLVIPDGYRQGEPYRLTDEMWRYVIHRYRVFEDAAPWPHERGMFYTGAQLRRSQKWGKDPLAAACNWADALGPSRFAGWDAAGNPVGAPYPTPLIVCLGTSQDQTDNTWRPMLAMARRGPLADSPDIREIHETKIELMSGGRIEPATTSATARLGAPMTHVSITESHLFARQLRKVAAAVKRNVAGMDGFWSEFTNAWDPSENSEAQVTGDSKDPRVYVDTIEPVRVEDLDDTEALYTELLRQYGDSARERGGWVNVHGRMVDECRSPRHTESDRRRFFLNEIVIGESMFVDPTKWDRLGNPPERLAPGTAIALGFDGAKYRDGTALVASRMSDGKLFEVGMWLRPADADEEWRVPAADVDARIRDAFGAYAVSVVFLDPWRWQDWIDLWSSVWPDRIVEFPTNREIRMDGAIERFQTAYASGEIANDGSPTLAEHMKNAVVVKGSRKKPRPGEDELLPTHYLKLAKKGDKTLIDGAVAAVLAHEARAYAIEHQMTAKSSAYESRDMEVV